MRNKTIKIPAHNQEIDIKIMDREMTLEELQEAVGGLIEIVPVELDGKEMTMVLNEEGKLNQLPVNNIATQIFQYKYGISDVIVGDVILVEVMS